MSWKNGFSVYRQTATDRELNQNKEKVAEFKLGADADHFAFISSLQANDWMNESVFWTVETAQMIIKKYEQVKA